jgi:hypothetical protein
MTVEVAAVLGDAEAGELFVLHNLDKKKKSQRMVEKVLIAVRSALGSNLEGLEVEFVSGWATTGTSEVRTPLIYSEFS